MNKQSVTVCTKALILTLEDINDKINDEDILLDEISYDIKTLIANIQNVYKLQNK